MRPARGAMGILTLIVHFTSNTSMSRDCQSEIDRDAQLHKLAYCYLLTNIPFTVQANGRKP